MAKNKPKNGLNLSKIDKKKSTNLLIDSDPDGLLSGECQGQVNTVESHPIYVLLPIRPLPKGESVARRADILIVAQLFFGRQGKLGHGQ